MTLVAPAGVAAASLESIARELRAVAGKHVFFGHQSVGGNILDGLQDLAREAGAPLRLQDDSPATGPAFVHARLGLNERPMTKIAAFEEAVHGRAASADVALFKFCYLDVSAGTDVEALIDVYRRSHEALQARHPRMTFVHVTVPLTVVQAGPRAWVKRVVGREPAGVQENAARERFNSALRNAYRGREPIFDLARVESGPEGSGLLPTYTDDGSHLNVLGRRVAARALLDTLARVV